MSRRMRYLLIAVVVLVVAGAGLGGALQGQPLQYTYPRAGF